MWESLWKFGESVSESLFVGVSLEFVSASLDALHAHGPQADKTGVNGDSCKLGSLLGPEVALQQDDVAFCLRQSHPRSMLQAGNGHHQKDRRLAALQGMVAKQHPSI